MNQARAAIKLILIEALWWRACSVIATGGLSIPKIGATDFGYRLAKQFDIPWWSAARAWCR